MFDTDEVLIAAKQMLMLDGFDIADDLRDVGYLHLLFDRHEVVIANGAEAESLYTGPESLASLGRTEMEEIFALMPPLREPGLREPGNWPEAARVLPSGRKARKLAVRHRQNQKPLVMDLPH